MRTFRRSKILRSVFNRSAYVWAIWRHKYRARSSYLLRCIRGSVIIIIFIKASLPCPREEASFGLSGDRVHGFLRELQIPPSPSSWVVIIPCAGGDEFSMANVAMTLAPRFRIGHTSRRSWGQAVGKVDQHCPEWRWDSEKEGGLEKQKN